MFGFSFKKDTIYSPAQLNCLAYTLALNNHDVAERSYEVCLINDGNISIARDKKCWDIIDLLAGQRNFIAHTRLDNEPRMIDDKDEITINNNDGQMISRIYKDTPERIYLCRRKDLSIFGIGKRPALQEEYEATNGIVWTNKQEHLLEALFHCGMSLPDQRFPYRTDKDVIYYTRNGDLYLDLEV